jgi:hypothetical protein
MQQQQMLQRVKKVPPLAKARARMLVVLRGNLALLKTTRMMKAMRGTLAQLRKRKTKEKLTSTYRSSPRHCRWVVCSLRPALCRPCAAVPLFGVFAYL